MSGRHVAPPWSARFVRVGGIDIANTGARGREAFLDWSRAEEWGLRKRTNEVLEPLGGVALLPGGEKRDGVKIVFAPLRTTGGTALYRPSVFDCSGNILKQGGESAVPLAGGGKNAGAPRYCLAFAGETGEWPEFEWGAAPVDLLSWRVSPSGGAQWNITEFSALPDWVYIGFASQAERWAWDEFLQLR